MSESSDLAVCRICLTGETLIPYFGVETGEQLLSLCLCSGSVGKYHLSCLEKWLTATKKKKCEICKFAFDANEHSYSWLHYLALEVFTKRRTATNRNPIADFVCFVFSTVVVSVVICFGVVVIIQCITEITRLQNDEASKNDSTVFYVPITILIVVILGSILIMGTFLSFAIALIRYHIRVFQIWKENNKYITIASVPRKKEHFFRTWLKKVFSRSNNEPQLVGPAMDDTSILVDSMEAIEQRTFASDIESQNFTHSEMMSSDFEESLPDLPTLMAYYSRNRPGAGRTQSAYTILSGSEPRNAATAMRSRRFRVENNIPPPQQFSMTTFKPPSSKSCSAEVLPVGNQE